MKPFESQLIKEIDRVKKFLSSRNPRHSFCALIINDKAITFCINDIISLTESEYKSLLESAVTHAVEEYFKESKQSTYDL